VWLRFCMLHYGVKPSRICLKSVIVLCTCIFVAWEFGGNSSGIMDAAFLCGFCSCIMITLTSPCSCSSSVWMLIKLMLTSKIMLALLALGMCIHKRRWLGFSQMLVLIFLTQLGASRERGRHSHNLYAIFFCIIVLAIASLPIYAFYMDSPQAALRQLGHNGGQNMLFSARTSQLGYPFCGFAQPMALNETVSDRCHDTQLSLVDFGKMSEISYAQSQAEANQRLNTSFPGWKVVHKTERSDHIDFMHVKRVGGHTHIIAVRGTQTTFDMIQDLNLWLPSVFLQIVGTIGPPIGYRRNLLKTITKLTSSLQLLGGSQEVNPRAFTSLLQYVRSQVNKTNLGEKQIYITGHSLGGGYAAIVGALESITAVTFSAPGLEATSAILSPTPELPRLRFTGINVVPDGDLVPQVDSQSGSVLKINCAKNAIDCHSIQSTLCELAAKCGDGGGRPQARDYTFTCPACAESVDSKSRDVPSWCTGRVARSVAPVLRMVV